MVKNKRQNHKIKLDQRFFGLLTIRLSAVKDESWKLSYRDYWATIQRGYFYGQAAYL
jgi:hypothetical protein